MGRRKAEPDDLISTSLRNPDRHCERSEAIQSPPPPYPPPHAGEGREGGASSASPPRKDESEILRVGIRSISGARRASPAASLPALLKAVEQTGRIVAGKRVQPVRLAGLDGVARDRAFGIKIFGFLFHLAVPFVRVVFADVHEHAHL